MLCWKIVFPTWLINGSDYLFCRVGDIEILKNRAEWEGRRKRARNGMDLRSLGVYPAHSLVHCVTRQYILVVFLLLSSFEPISTETVILRW